MVYFNDKSNFLEFDSYNYSLQDVETPNLYRDIFDYENIPKVPFNHRHVPMNPPAEIWITDTTFRDGQQSTSPFSVEQSVELFKLMNRLGGPKGIIRQSEFFLYSEKDQKAVEKCMELGLHFPEITSWIRASEKDFELVKSMGVKETGILVSCSDYHIFKKMNMTRKQALDKYMSVIKSAIEHGVRPRCHFEDITRADFYGFVVPFATELMKLMEETKVPIKIRACDTMGFGVNYPGTALPRSVQGIIYGLRSYAKVPAELLEWHGHNDFYKVVSNSTTAWLYGCASVNASLLGLGERTGNCPLEAMAIEYASLRGTADGMDFTAITDIAEYFEKELKIVIPQTMPFVGRSFNATRAGIHADGLLKDEEIYNIFDTTKILNRRAHVSINNASGLAGIAYWMNDYYELPEQYKMDKKDPIVEKIKKMIDEEYANGRMSIMGDSELDNMVRVADKNRHKQLIILGE